MDDELTSKLDFLDGNWCSECHNLIVFTSIRMAVSKLRLTNQNEFPNNGFFRDIITNPGTYYSLINTYARLWWLM